MQHERPRRRLGLRLLRGLGLALLVALAADQIVHHLVLSGGSLGRQRVAPFDPPLFTEGQRQAVERLRRGLAAGRPVSPIGLAFDADLGWRTDTAPEEPPRAGQAQLLVYGCSFTFGSEVEPAETWPARLDAAREDTVVLNRGVPGYGLDQALLCYRRERAALQPDVVWLCWLPEASPRNLTVYRPAADHWTSMVAFKPRFTLVDGVLALHTCPVDGLADTLATLDDQERFVRATLGADSFVARTPAAYAAAGSSLLHHSAIGRLVLTLLDHRGRDCYRELADAGSESSRLVVALANAMASEVRTTGARFTFVVLPGRRDLEATRRADGRAPWSAITAELRGAGIAVVDPTTDLLADGFDRSASAWMPEGHYSPAGNARIAELLEPALAR